MHIDAVNIDHVIPLN